MVITVNDYEKIRTMYMREYMSQRAIAKALGISRNTVASIARVLLIRDCAPITIVMPVS